MCEKTYETKFSVYCKTKFWHETSVDVLDSLSRVVYVKTHIFTPSFGVTANVGKLNASAF